MNSPRLPPVVGTPAAANRIHNGSGTRSDQMRRSSEPGVMAHNTAGLNVGDNIKVNDILQKLEIENKIKEGAENLLQVFDTRKLKEGKEAYKQQVESQLDAANAKIQLLQLQLHEYGLSRSSLDVSQTSKDDDESDVSDELDPGQESPTWSLGDILQSLENANKDFDSEYLVNRSNELVSLLQRHPLLKYDLAMSQVGDRIRALLLHQRTEVVAAGYRVTRYAITDLESLKNVRGLYTDYLIVKTLTKDSKSQIERIQALKLIRAFLDVPGGVDELSVGIIRALVAVSEQSDDKLRNIVTETLTEIFIQNPNLISKGGGIRVLLQYIVEGPSELSVPVSMALIYVLDSPNNRSLVRNGKDLEYLISVFTDFQNKGHVHTEKLFNSANVIATILRSWSGLTAFSSNNFNILKTLVSCLGVPIPAMRDVLFDFFFTIFRIKTSSWSSSYLAGRKLTTFGRVDLKQEANQPQDCCYVNHYTALLLRIIVKECNLVSELCHIVEADQEPGNTRKAMLLLSEVLSLSERLLPMEDVKEIVMLPELFSSAVRRASVSDAKASGALIQIDRISRNLHKTDINSERGGGDRGKEQARSNQVKVKMGVQIDDNSFKQLIMDTNVLNTKTYTKWNWDALSELIQGPLLNPRRLEEAIKTTKFMKRLMSFYRPFKYRFSSIKRTKPNQKYVEVGRLLLNTMLYNPEGVKYLTENKLLRQIAECLAQLDPMSGITSPEPLFSSQRLQHTVSYGYFTLLGTLSADSNGMLMMERWRMFNMFYHLSELSSREDLITNFIQSMDYKLPGHPRIILSKTLTTAHKDMRIFATNYLRNLLKSEANTQRWAIGLLVTQLYDPEVEVCKLAVEVLEEFCEVTENLEHFVRLQPSLGHLGDIGSPLLLRFLSSSLGFKYLKDLDYVHQEMDNWFHGQNENYVAQIEEFLESAQSTWVPESLIKKNEHNTIIPRHFYGELTLTEEGCNLLSSKGHFTSFAAYIDQHKMEEDDNEIITKLKGSIWAVGNIGKNPLGAPFLEDSNVVEDITNIAMNSPICTLKGTAYFTLGLISSTQEGCEILDELGWVMTMDVMNEPRGITMPFRLSDMFHTPIEEPQEETEFNEEEMTEEDFPLLTNDPVKRRIIIALSNLSNQILANEASRTLVKLESKYGTRFQSTDVLQEAMSLMERYHYKLPIRRFIFELFDTEGLIEKMAKRAKEQFRRARHTSDTTNQK